jgi:hypothetical protein
MFDLYSKSNYKLWKSVLLHKKGTPLRVPIKQRTDLVLVILCRALNFQKNINANYLKEQRIENQCQKNIRKSYQNVPKKFWQSNSDSSSSAS